MTTTSDEQRSGVVNVAPHAPADESAVHNSGDFGTTDGNQP